jgi:hypothetical protein
MTAVRKPQHSLAYSEYMDATRFSIGCLRADGWSCIASLSSSYGIQAAAACAAMTCPRNSLPHRFKRKSTWRGEHLCHVKKHRPTMAM